MTKNEITVEFAGLCDQAEEFNGRRPGKRFFPMFSYRGRHLHEFGMYDGGRKKYVLCEVNSPHAPNRLIEIRNMLRTE